MKIGDRIKLEITDLGANGEGIGHMGEYTVFVPFALPGEIVLTRVEHIKKTIAFTSLIKVFTPSPFRIEPICPVFTRCGGCDLMHLSYEEQLKYKQKNLVNILKKNAGYTGEVDSVIPSSPLYYRNKIQLPFGINKGKVVLGFFASGSHDVIPLEKCYLHNDWADKLISIVLSFVNDTAQSVYDEKTGKGLLRHLTARYIGGKLSVTLVINGDLIKDINILRGKLTKEFPSAILSLSINTKRNNVIMGDKIITVSGEEQTLDIGGIKQTLNPLSFFQVNDEIRDKIYNRIIQTVLPDKDTVFIDCYAGVGLLGAIIAKSGAQIFNIEIIEEAVEDAERLYSQNNLASKVTNIHGDAAEELPKVLSGEDFFLDNKRVFIFVDPPRKGLSPELISTLNSLPEANNLTLIYLSCNPATLSRDLSLLTAYQPHTVTPYDMFPQTKHLETFVCLTRKKEPACEDKKHIKIQ